MRVVSADFREVADLLQNAGFVVEIPWRRKPPMRPVGSALRCQVNAGRRERGTTRKHSASAIDKYLHRSGRSGCAAVVRRSCRQQIIALRNVAPGQAVRIAD